MIVNIPLCHALPKKGLPGPFKTSTLIKRDAVQSKALAFGEQFYIHQIRPDATPLCLPFTAEAPKTLDTLPPNQHKKWETAIPFSFIVDDLLLMTFEDNSAFLCRINNDTLTLYPEVLMLSSSLYKRDDKNLTLRIRSLDTQHGLYRGPEHLFAPYLEALYNDMRFWAQALDTLPHPSDPRTDAEGYWPAFAPLKGIKQAAKEQADEDVTNLLITIAQLTHSDGASLVVTGPLNDGRDPQKVTFVLQTGQKTPGPIPGTFGWKMTPLKKLKPWMETWLAHHAFPIQGRAWLRQPPKGAGTSPQKQATLSAFIDITQLTAHNVADAMVTHQGRYGDLALPVI